MPPRCLRSRVQQRVPEIEREATSIYPRLRSVSIVGGSDVSSIVLLVGALTRIPPVLVSSHHVLRSLELRTLVVGHH